MNRSSADWRRYEPHPDNTRVLAAAIDQRSKVTATWGELHGKAGDDLVKSFVIARGSALRTINEWSAERVGDHRRTSRHPPKAPHQPMPRVPVQRILASHGNHGGKTIPDSLADGSNFQEECADISLTRSPNGGERVIVVIAEGVAGGPVA